ncbi:MAG: plastocyanin/azurin family copper-binding protein [Bdellovibrionaceae bacterium]|nr:plastocyanin/azurin family copper-binding protein [Pseudobdellovibrionaceae bacterium]
MSATNNERFEPATISIRVGDTVRWTNTSSSLIHTVTFDASLADDPSHVELPAGADPFNSGNIAPGGTFTRTFTVPGTYRYFCIPHEDEPMVGSITVSP